MFVETPRVKVDYERLKQLEAALLAFDEPRYRNFAGDVLSAAIEAVDRGRAYKEQVRRLARGETSPVLSEKG